MMDQPDAGAGTGMIVSTLKRMIGRIPTIASTAYAGDIGSWQAWDMLADHAQAVLVDIRTREEWELVGRPNLAMLDKEPLFVSWQLTPDMRRNPDFAAAIEGHRVPRDAPILLLCRSGKRSREAATALAELGYTACYNVADGFEGRASNGEPDGWQALGLPWSQD